MREQVAYAVSDGPQISRADNVAIRAVAMATMTIGRIGLLPFPGPQACHRSSVRGTLSPGMRCDRLQMHGLSLNGGDRTR